MPNSATELMKHLECRGAEGCFGGTVCNW